MEEIDSSLPSPVGVKRPAPEEDTPNKKPLNLKGTQFTMPTPPDTESSSNVSPTKVKTEKLRCGSPAPSISTLSSVDVSTVDNARNGPAATDTSGPPPPKRRKLTPREKEEKAKEKEAKEKERAEMKAKREEEKQVKDEEKRQKAEEREAKKREKELQEEKKIQEKLKKERAQMRLGAFFQPKPTTPARASDDSGKAHGSARRKSLSLEPYDAVKDLIRESTPGSRSKTPKLEEPPTREATPAPIKPEISDYSKYFLPFELPTNSTLYKDYTIKNEHDLAYWQGQFDSELKDPSFSDKIDLGIVPANATLDHHFSAERNIPRGVFIPSIRELMSQIQGTFKTPIDLTKDQTQQTPLSILQALPRRHIEFQEDVRPPYSGTYTLVRSPQKVRKACRKPFEKVRPDTDYDYDSELEWEENGEDGEAESLRGDDDDEAESQGDLEEMAGFVCDDNDGTGTKRKFITGDLIPACTGLCWGNGQNKLDRRREEMHGMSIGFLLPGLTTQSIDPFATTYWQTEMAPPPAPTVDFFNTKAGRTPLQERSTNASPLINSSEDGKQGPITVVPTKPKKEKGERKAAPKLISSEELERFKVAVVGSPLTKVQLQQGLKDRFSKVTIEVIRDTLGTLFARQGTGRDKVWVYTGMPQSSPAPAALTSDDLSSES